MFVDQAELMMKGEEGKAGPARKYEGLKIARDANDDYLGEFLDFEIRKIGEHFKAAKMGCTQQCSLCGAICEEKKGHEIKHGHETKHLSRNHFFPGLLGTFIYFQTIENGVAREVKLLIDDKSCMEMQPWMIDSGPKGFVGWLNTKSEGVKFLCCDNEIGSFTDVIQKKYLWEIASSNISAKADIKKIL